MQSCTLSVPCTLMALHSAFPSELGFFPPFFLRAFFILFLILGFIFLLLFFWVFWVLDWNLVEHHIAGMS
jgi:hypothetical protein